MPKKSVMSASGPHYTSTFDALLDQVPIYKQFPCLKPSVGESYGVSVPKILLIGESHYLPKKSTVHLEADAWYQLDQRALAVVGEEDEREWMDTRGILKKKRGYWKQGHAIYRNLETALHEAGIPQSSNAFQYIAFMNAFQRPAASGQTITASEQDINVAQETVSSVIQILEPELIIFVSSKARDLVAKKLGNSYFSTPHPACAHWNNNNLKKGSGREQFIGHIRRFYTSLGSQSQS